MAKYEKVARLGSPAAVRECLQRLATENDFPLELPIDDDILVGDASPMSQAIKIGSYQVGNRWCIHPMEGWDANRDGSPSELTLRRWQRFGLSGAKLIWGGEAAAVQPDGRANPNQTLAVPENLSGLTQLREVLVAAHQEHFDSTDDLLVGLQLTHSGPILQTQ